MCNLFTVEPWGGVKEYGRNCFYIECGKKKILLDCGIHKGTKKNPDLNSQKVQALDYVFLSHSHIDHYGAINKLYELGYKNEVYMTKDTKEQIEDYLTCNKNIRVEVLEDICKPLVWHKMDKDIDVLWGRSGHVQGALWIALKFKERVLFYSGDYSKETLLISNDDPVEALKKNMIDYGIIDCGSGMLNKTFREVFQGIQKDILDAISVKGNVLFLSHIYGKATELFVLLLRELKGIQFAVTKEFYKSVKELVKKSPYMYIDELEDLRNNICIIDKSFDFSKTKGSSKVYFCENIIKKDDFGYNFLKEIQTQKESKIVFTSRQPKDSIGLYMISNNEKYNAEIKYINIKAHQSLDEAVTMAKSMNIKKSIYFHLDER